MSQNSAARSYVHGYDLKESLRLQDQADAFDRGLADLYRTAESDGVFCYTFFKATCLAP